MEASAIWVLGLTLLVAGAVLIGVGAKQKAGTLRRNWLVGLRTSETMRSDAAWQAAHTATAGTIVAAGVVQVVAGLALLVVQPTDDASLAIIVLGGALLTLVLVLAAGVRGHRIAAGVDQSGPEDLEYDRRG